MRTSEPSADIHGVPTPPRLRLIETSAGDHSANVVPSWVMPLMRLMRGKAGGDLAKAWAALPQRLPHGITPPTEAEAAAVLLHHGLV